MKEKNEKTNLEMLQEEIEVLTQAYVVASKRPMNRLKLLLEDGFFDFKFNIDIPGNITLKQLITNLSEILSLYWKNGSKCIGEIEDLEYDLCGDTFFKDNILYIKDVDSKEEIFSVDLTKEPRLLKGDSKAFRTIKTCLYDLKYTIDEYKNFIKNSEKEIQISKKTKLNIDCDAEYLNINVTVKISDLAIIEILIFYDGQVKYSSYSEDLKISRYLNKNQIDLCNKICIPKTEIEKLLYEYSKYMGDI